MHVSRPLCFLVAAAALASPALAGGMAQSDNFIVLAENRALAQTVLDRAEEYRREIARQWLGQELPPSVGRTLITVEIDPQNSRGLTWAVDRSSPAQRKYHKLWVTGSLQEVQGGMLRHEVAHTVLATQFPKRLPAWIDEGIASRYDDQERLKIRDRLLKWHISSGNWPRLAVLFNSEQILGSDQASYSVAASVTDYLLEQSGQATLLKFAQDGAQRGWDQSLQRHYQINGLGDLQSRWQDWAQRNMNRLASRDTTPSALR